MKKYFFIILSLTSIFICIFGLFRYRTWTWLVFLALGTYFLSKSKASSNVTNEKLSELEKETENAVLNPETDSNNIVKKSQGYEQKIVNTAPKAQEKLTFSFVSKEEKLEQFSQTLSSLPIVKFDLCEQIIKKRQASDFDYDAFKKPNITRATKRENICDFVVIDIETTGIAVSNSIIEISALKFEDFKPKELFTSLVKPQKKISEESISINGITNEMTENAPTFNQIALAFSEFIAGYNIVGHNLPFDMKFLFVKGIDFSLKCKYYDTLDIAHKTIKKYNDRMRDYETIRDSITDYKLDTLLDYYGIERNVSHRSSSDCLATGYLFYELINDKTSYAFS